MYVSWSEMDFKTKLLINLYKIFKVLGNFSGVCSKFSGEEVTVPGTSSLAI